MKEAILTSFILPVVVFAYWLSLIVIGAFLLHVLRRKFKFKFPVGVSDNLPLLAVLCFASSVVVMGLFSLFLYVFKLPAILFTAFYACSLVVAVGYLGRLLWLASAKKTNS